MSISYDLVTFVIILIDWNAFGFVLASGYRQKVLLSIENNPKTPKEISNETGLYLTHVSTTIAELVKVDLIKCLTPALRRGKIFDLTNKGKEIEKELIKRNQKK